MSSKLNILSLFFILLFVASCDFSTHEYVSYSGYNEQYHSDIHLGWSDEGVCSISIYDSSYNTPIDFDEVEIEFPSDGSKFTSKYAVSYSYRWDDEGANIVDTTEYWNYEFDLKEDDSLVSSNDFIIASFYLKKKK